MRNCRQCEDLCFQEQNFCDKNDYPNGPPLLEWQYAMGVNISLIAIYFICLVLLVVRFVQFVKHIPKPVWSLKKIVYCFAITYFVFRIVRFALKASGLDVPKFVDRFLYWYGYWFSIAIFILLVLYWSNLCANKNQIVFAWLGKESKKFFIGWLVVLALLVTGVYVGELVAGTTQAVAIFFNIAWIVATLFTTIVTIIEGSKLGKMISNFEDKSENTRMLLAFYTRLTTGLSIGLISVIIILIVATSVRVAYPEYNICQSFQLLYRIIEIFLVLFPCWALRRYQSRQSSVSLPSSEKVSSRGTITV